MILLQISQLPIEKISFTVALIIAIVWLWRDRMLADKKRDEEFKVWQAMYKESADEIYRIAKETISVIAMNNEVIEKNISILQQVLQKMNKDV